MEPDDRDPELAALRAALTEAHGEGRWYLWRGDDGGAGILHAWLFVDGLSTSPPVVLYDRTGDGLRLRCDEFEAVLAENPGRLGKALAAAERLQT